VTSFVLDASVALAWVLPEADSERCEPLFRQASLEGAAAPILWPIEVGNVLLMMARRNKIEAEEHARAIKRLAAIAVQLDDAMARQGPAEAVRLAQAHRLTLYDALYLELAKRLGLPLASLDWELRTAATAEGVALLP
jgi:predicted nucleic acid-binding protein